MKKSSAPLTAVIASSTPNSDSGVHSLGALSFPPVPLPDPLRRNLLVAVMAPLGAIEDNNLLKEAEASAISLLFIFVWVG